MASVVLYAPRENSLSRYLQDIRKFPLLTLEEELSFARRWREERDQSVANKLITSHLRLVAKIAMGYSGYGLPISELISEGNIGLMRAMGRYDPERGFRFATYAMWWIRAAIQEYILRSWSLVKIGTTGAQKKLFFNLRRLKGQLQAIEDRELDPEQVSKIARTLDVPEQDVVSMSRRLAAPDSSLNAPVRTDGEGEWQDWLIEESESQESAIAREQEMSGRRALLPHALKTLNDRERHILIERRLKEDPVTLDELSQQYGISRERVRQIEVRAFEKLQKAMKTQMSANAHKGDQASVPSKPTTYNQSSSKAASKRDIPRVDRLRPYGGLKVLHGEARETGRRRAPEMTIPAELAA